LDYFAMSVDLSEIQNLADELSKEENPTPDLPIPANCDQSGNNLLEIRDTTGKGKGFYAKQDINAGTTLIGAKPISLVMDWEEDDEEDEMSMCEDDGEEDCDVMKGSKRNGMLLARLAKAMKEKPSIWFEQVSNLFPRQVTDTIWICECPETGMEIERAMNALAEVHQFDDDAVDEIRLRLPLIIRYNCLSVETGSELFVHPNQERGGHIALSGTGLYYHPSYFNHSHTPNVARYSIGDVMFFVSNRGIKCGEELCISYIESEHLCENPRVRTNLLDMDFEENSVHVVVDGAETTYPIIDLDMQDELMSIHPIERLDEIKRLLKQATSDTVTLDDEGEELRWFKSDAHQLRIILALTYDSIGQHTNALKEWEQCIVFVKEHLPPCDESAVALYVQGALCAQASGQWSTVKAYSKLAMETHDLLFGGGVQFFRQRYAKEAELTLRPPSKKVLNGSAAFDLLWRA
jgi:hypothetical protein